MMGEHKVELLAPGGSAAGIRAAVNAGANAVYAAGTMFGARAYADNPDRDALLAAIDYCHLHGAKLYMTVNTLMKEEELEKQLAGFLLPYYERGLDAVLVQDLGVLQLIRQQFPDLPIHASTQMSIQSVDGAQLAAALGITRVVPARELSLSEIREIYDRTGLEIECFVHGALCYSYSGQCLLSSLIGGRSGNRGRCAQPCRKRYTLTDETGRRLSEPDRAYLMSLKDICALKILPELIEAGVASFKIEGRMKRPEYAAGVSAIYRKYIDLYEKAGADGYTVEDEDIRILMDLYNRGGFSDGYYHVRNSPKMMVMDRPNHAGTPAASCSMKKGGTAVWTAQEALYPGDILEYMGNVPAPGRNAGGRTETPAASLHVIKQVARGERLGDANVRGLQRSPGPSLQEPSGGRKDRAGGRMQYPGGKPGRAGAGMQLRRTHCAHLLAGLEETYIRNEKKEKIKGNFTLKRGMPAILKASCGQYAICAQGEVPFEAQKRPLEKDDIIRQLSKTNDTPFVFEDLDGTVEAGLFLPMGALNSLRREALTKLEEAILQSRRRVSGQHNCGEKAAACLERGASERGPERGAERISEIAEAFPSLTVSVSSRDQLETILEMIRTAKTASDIPGTGQGIWDLSNVRGIILDTAMYMDMAAQMDTSAYKDMAAQMDTSAYKDTGVHVDPAANKGPDGANGIGQIRKQVLADIHAVRLSGMRCTLALPCTWRAHVREKFFAIFEKQVLRAADSLMLRCLDQINAFALTDRGYTLAADSNLYVFNHRAAEVLDSLGIRELTFPSELNHRELASLTKAVRTAADHAHSDGIRMELPVYGYQTSMITAQCLKKNLAGCDRVPGIFFLSDERGARFPVRSRCGSCMNEIFNSTPLDLTDLAEELPAVNAQSLRISFTVESADEMRTVLERAGKRGAGESDFTRGHFRRGVE